MAAKQGAENQSPSFPWSRLSIGNAAPDSAIVEVAHSSAEEPSAGATQPMPGQMYRRASPSNGGAAVSDLRQEIEATRHDLQQNMQGLYDMVGKLLERKPVDQSVFDALHEELKDYKDDFFYERLKPIVRPLIFLLDSIDLFEAELTERLALRIATDPETTELTRDNLCHFREQLVHILTICETFPLEDESSVFDPTIHRAVEQMSVPLQQDNSVQRVVRSGWTLRGHLLRHIEVVRGRAA